MIDAPKRIWAWTSGQAAGMFDTSFHDNISTATEYIRADEVQALIAEAEARGLDRAVGIAKDHTPEKHTGMTLQAHVTGRNIADAITAEAHALRAGIPTTVAGLAA